MVLLKFLVIFGANFSEPEELLDLTQERAWS
jgi:hypothetical protein